MARADDEEFPLEPMSPEAKEFYEKHFLSAYEGLVDKINRTPFAVLVWGPGTAGGDLYAKRVQILNSLRAVNVSAIFSEHVDDDVAVPGMSARDRELLQAIAADYIVILAASAGPLAETHDFSGFTREVAPKMLVFLDEAHVGGYSATGALADLQEMYGNVETYKYPEDIRECHLLGRVIKKVSVFRRAKWRSSLS